MTRFIGVPKQTGPRGGVGASVRILGVPEALIKLGLVNKIARLELGFLSKAAAAFMYERARVYCPVITGNLKSSIRVLKLGPYSHQVTAASREGDNATKNKKEYAGFVEFGRTGMAPRWFMTKAYQETRPLVAVRLQEIAMKLESL